jgi:hypothetical protein
VSQGRFLAAVAIAAACLSACDESPTTPSSSAIVTFQVSNEQFKVRLTTAEQLAAAQAARSGGPARIPNGRIVVGRDVNAPWNWHLVDVEFAEVTVEVCDGRPSDVERNAASFGGGRFCPWSATIVRIDET